MNVIEVFFFTKHKKKPKVFSYTTNVYSPVNTVNYIKWYYT